MGVRGWLADALDCVPSVQGSNPGCHRVKDRSSLLPRQHLCRLRRQCLSSLSALVQTPSSVFIFLVNTCADSIFSVYLPCQHLCRLRRQCLSSLSTLVQIRSSCTAKFVSLLRARPSLRSLRTLKILRQPSDRKEGQTAGDVETHS